MRKFLIAVAITIAAVSAFAQLSPQNRDWAKGPVQWLMTPEEQAQWKNVKTDADAQAFIDLFWAKRDPSPGTPQNEYKDRFDQLVKYSDDRFSTGRSKGSLTDRGKVFIVFGPPKSMQHGNLGPTTGAADDRGFGMNEGSATASGSSSTEKSGREVWIYEGDSAQKGFGSPKAEVDFLDQFNSNEWRIQRGKVDIPTAQRNVIAASIVQPSLTAAPKFGATAAAPAPAATATTTTTTTTKTTTTTTAPAAPAAPPAYATTFKTEALATAVKEFDAAKTNPYKHLFVTYGEYVTPQGEYYVPVELYVPKVANLDPNADLTFFGAIEDNGAPIAVFEEPAKLAVSKDDLYLDKSLMLPAGKHKGVFGIAANGKPISMVSTEMNLAGSIDKDATGISSLILSNNVYPLPTAQKPTDPFAFGGIKVVPKGDRTFHPSDELWYFFELRNPGLNEQNVPSIQLKLEMTGTAIDPTGKTKGKQVEMTKPPFPVDAQELKGVPGHFGVGSSIPLATIAPGDYTLKVKVTDQVKKTSYNLSEDFKIAPEGK